MSFVLYSFSWKKVQRQLKCFVVNHGWSYKYLSFTKSDKNEVMKQILTLQKQITIHLLIEKKSSVLIKATKHDKIKRKSVKANALSI